MRAFADESFGRLQTKSVYVMCAALVEDDELEGIRIAMRGVRKGLTKLHWYDESSRRRQRLLEVVSGLNVEFVITQQTALKPQQPLMRRTCLRELSHKLATRGVEQLTLESRNRVDDRRDIVDMNWIRQSEGSSVWLRHVRGVDEPALWLADLICGASLARLRGDGTYTHALRRLHISHV